MNNKDLDRLFQEKLKNLEATPNKRVWNTIESKLKKKKRKALPFWWFTSGIVALFILGFFLFPFSNDDNILDKNDSKIIITEAPKDVKETTVIPKIDSIIQQKNDQEKVWVANEKTTLKKVNDKKKERPKNSDETKKLVSKKTAMKKIFLTDNSTHEKEDLDKKKHINSHQKEAKNRNKKRNKETSKKNITKKTTTKKGNFPSLIKKKDTVLVTKSIKNKWAVAPVFGVLNSNSFSDTSPLEKNLSNSTIGKSSFSFGVQVAYKINKKWTIRTGIHKQEVSYLNNKITVVPSTSSSKSVISLNNNAAVSFKNNKTLSSNLSDNSTFKSPVLTGDLNQTFGYIEIPFEIKYRFLKAKKFDTQIVAGFSSLFLNKNEINIKTQFQTEFGNVNNLNNINFSGNFGFDFNYLVTKKWSLNFNPMFKAQLNTFSDSANGFSPFNVGLYTGLKYRF